MLKIITSSDQNRMSLLCKSMFLNGLAILAFSSTILPLNAQSTNETQPITTMARVNHFAPGAITFYYGSGGDAIQQEVRSELFNQLKSDFTELQESQITISGPWQLGYQMHVKPKVSLGFSFNSSSVTTPRLEYPDFQNPGSNSTFDYRISMNSLTANFDYYWWIKPLKRSTLAINSGLALGVNVINVNTRLLEGSGNGVPTVNISRSGTAAQVTLIGIKQAFYMKYLKGFGYHANFGAGTTSIGFNAGINYTL